MSYTGNKKRRTVSISNCKTTGYNLKACKETAQKISRCTWIFDRPDTSAETG